MRKPISPYFRRYLQIALALVLAVAGAHCNESEKFAKLGWAEIDAIRKGENKDANVALNHFERSLQSDEKNVLALHGIGVILGSNPATQKIGIMKLKEAIKVDPMYPGAYIDLAQILKQDDLKDAALSILEEGLQKDPNSVKLLIARGAFLGDIGQYNEAEASLVAAEKVAPKNSLIPYNRALLFVQQQDMNSAEKYFRKAVALHDENPDYLSGLARTLLHTKVELETKIEELKKPPKNKYKKPATDPKVEIEKIKKEIAGIESQARSLVDKALILNPKHRSSLQLRYEVLDKDKVAEMFGGKKTEKEE